MLDDVAKDVARRDRTKPGGDEVTKGFDVIEPAENGQLNGVTMDLLPFLRSFTPFSPKGLTIRKSQWKAAWPSSKNC